MDPYVSWLFCFRARFHWFILNLVCLFNVTCTFSQVLGLCNSGSITLSTFPPHPNPHSPISTPLVMYVCNCSNWNFSGNAGISRSVIISSCGIQEIKRTLLVFIICSQVILSWRFFHIFLFIQYIYTFSLSVYSLEEEVLSLKEQGCSNRGWDD